MDIERARERLTGSYVTIPTMFHDDDLDLNLAGLQQHVRFLVDGGLVEGNCMILSGGGEGDFSRSRFPNDSRPPGRCWMPLMGRYR
jgi:hypothetical protein